MVLMSPSPSTRCSLGRSFFANEVFEWESEIVLPMSLSTQAWVLVPEVVGFMFEGIRGIVIVMGLAECEVDVGLYWIYRIRLVVVWSD